MRIFRFSKLYGSDGLLGVGRSKFFADFILRSEADRKIPGTSIDRLSVLRLGRRARGVSEDEVARVIEGLKVENHRRDRSR
jgi:hypothetical protein